MPPTDNNTPTPPITPAPEPPKQGFWAKLFGKKPEVPAQPVAVPPVTETAPLVQEQPAQVSQPEPEYTSVENNPVVQPEETDPTTGAPVPETESAPDADGTTTVPTVEVPESVASPAEGETPTVPVQSPAEESDPQPEQAPDLAAPTVEPTDPAAPTNTSKE
jgi:hypothetical protein